MICSETKHLYWLSNVATLCQSIFAGMFIYIHQNQNQLWRKASRVLHVPVVWLLPEGDWTFKCLYLYFCSRSFLIVLKGDRHEFFDVRFPEYSNGAVSNCLENSQRYSRMIIYHRCQRKKFETVLIGYSEARGTLIHEKNSKLKFSCQTPFNRIAMSISECAVL